MMAGYDITCRANTGRCRDDGLGLEFVLSFPGEPDRAFSSYYFAKLFARRRQRELARMAA